MKLVKRSDSVSKETNQLGVSRRAFMKTLRLPLVVQWLVLVYSHRE
ncbi:formate dehydrogenase-O, major subunit [Vibrio sp. JCM 19053]|nr:formate dehydrogenase-O, major subunit [Vibrio sp. JCM 19053]